ncbi:MAG: tetratricopeptide repeat protein [Verrucomicrobiae bacterium]|nr:tetratricopeptide repeat protein [Verrucomicrobiae bacterium]
MDKIRLIKHLEAIEGYTALGMAEDALAEADAALAEAPEAEVCLRAKAFLLLSLKRYAEAAPWFEKLLAANPRNVEAWIHLAYCRRRTTSLDAAIETLQCALRLDAGHPLANYNMACYCALKGRTEEALRLLKKAIRKDPAYRELARGEADFDSIRALPEFCSLIGGS